MMWCMERAVTAMVRSMGFGIDRNVPRKPRLVGGVKGYNTNETSFAHILFATGAPGKLFDKLRAVRFVERPRRACPVLTGWAGSFNPTC